MHVMRSGPMERQRLPALRGSGLRVMMLTGDSEAAAAPIAKQAGITEVEAGLDPAGKLARIRALQQSGLRVGMVGDGINDAGALAQADAGIAMGTGADLAQEAGDVLLLRSTPAAIPAALDLARSTLRVMRQNLVWAAGYNLLGIPLAAGAALPRFPYPSQSLGCRGGNGFQFGQRAQQQPSFAAVAAGCTVSTCRALN